MPSGKNKQQSLPIHQNPIRASLFLGLTSNHPCLLIKTRQEHNPYLFTKPGKSVAFPKTHKPQPLILDLQIFL